MSRPHRFRVDVELEASGDVVGTHLADPGRLKEVLTEGTTLWVDGVFPPPRKLAYSTVLAEIDGVHICLVSTLPNKLFPTLMAQGLWPSLNAEAATHLLAERKKGASRFDFGLPTENGATHWIEIKGVGLGKEGVGYFPDAPSKRAKKHVDELREIALEGGEATLVLVGQRGDLTHIEPARWIDPAFADALQAADTAGVRLLGATVRYAPEGAVEAKSIPVLLGPSSEQISMF